MSDLEARRAVMRFLQTDRGLDPDEKASEAKMAARAIKFLSDAGFELTPVRRGKVAAPDPWIGKSHVQRLLSGAV